MQCGWNDNEKVYSSNRKHIFNVWDTHCTLDNRVYLQAGFTGAVVEHAVCPSRHIANTGVVWCEFTLDAGIKERSVHFTLSNTMVQSATLW